MVGVVVVTYVCVGHGVLGADGRRATLVWGGPARWRLAFASCCGCGGSIVETP
jgi:hypothetical protein